MAQQIITYTVANTVVTWVLIPVFVVSTFSITHYFFLLWHVHQHKSLLSFSACTTNQRNIHRLLRCIHIHFQLPQMNHRECANCNPQINEFRLYEIKRRCVKKIFHFILWTFLNKISIIATSLSENGFCLNLSIYFNQPQCSTIT